jgi:hypothetical protein
VGGLVNLAVVKRNRKASNASEGLGTGKSGRDRVRKDGR